MRFRVRKLRLLGVVVLLSFLIWLVRVSANQFLEESHPRSAEEPLYGFESVDAREFWPRSLGMDAPVYIRGATFANRAIIEELLLDFQALNFRWPDKYLPVPPHYSAHTLSPGKGMILGVRHLYVDCPNCSHRQPINTWITIYCPAGLKHSQTSLSFPDEAILLFTTGAAVGFAKAGTIRIDVAEDRTLVTTIDAHVRTWNLAEPSRPDTMRFLDFAISGEYTFSPMALQEYETWERHRPTFEEFRYAYETSTDELPGVTVVDDEKQITSWSDLETSPLQE